MNSLSYKVPTDEAVMVMSKLTMIVNNGKFISCFTIPLLTKLFSSQYKIIFAKIQFWLESFWYHFFFNSMIYPLALLQKSMSQSPQIKRVVTNSGSPSILKSPPQYSMGRSHTLVQYGSVTYATRIGHKC